MNDNKIIRLMGRSPTWMQGTRADLIAWCKAGEPLTLTISVEMLERYRSIGYQFYLSELDLWQVP